MSHRSLLCLAALAAILLCIQTAWSQTQVPSNFEKDVRALTKHPHRLAGTPYGRAAGDYILKRLKEAGVAEVFPVDMVVWQTHVHEASLALGEQTFTLEPVRSNVTVPSVTEAAGLTSRVVYVGDGKLESYGSRDVKDAIVVMEYASQDRWELAFAQGAKAVLFLGNGQEVDNTPKFASVPTRQLRFFIPHDTPGIDALRKDHPQAGITSRITWQQGLGRNIIARIPGSDPDFAASGKGREAIVIAANYDSFGMVPTRSPAARSAANVANLLHMAASYAKSPLKRDVIFMFLDNESRYHRGARETYHALMLTEPEFQTIVKEHENELQWNTILINMLKTTGYRFQHEAVSLPQNAAASLSNYRQDLNELLKVEADFVRTDILLREQPLNLERYRLQRSMARSNENQPTAQSTAKLQAIQQQLEDLNEQRGLWDQIRRELHKARVSDFYIKLVNEASSDVKAQARLAKLQPVLTDLKHRVLRRLEKRHAELQTQIRIDQQQAQMRESVLYRDVKGELLTPWICVHVDMNLSGQTKAWSVVAGDWTPMIFRAQSPEVDADQPGFYANLLSEFGKASREVGTLAMFSHDPLLDPLTGYLFATGPFVSSGYIAGGYGIYNASCITGYDARVFDGQPSDTPDRLKLKQLQNQCIEATALLRAAANRESLSMERVFKDVTKSSRAVWSNGRWQGPSAQMRVSGDLSENRPAADAILAVWPGREAWKTSKAWDSQADAGLLASFDAMTLLPVNADGRFSLLGMRKDMDVTPMLIGATFDAQGVVQAITTQETSVQSMNGAISVDLFPCHGYELVTTRTYPTRPEALRILRGANSANFRSNRSLWGQLDNQTFFYTSNQVFDRTIKVFQPMGPVALNITASEPFGEGYPASLFRTPPSMLPITARDLWELNEARLDRLRERSVTSADLELLHARALRERHAAEQHARAVMREGLDLQSASLSHRVYAPLRQVMDDLVYAVVVLLLLAIPFAFAMERLVICASSIYGRIAGFVGMFFLTFLLLYFMHPGFAIGQTPIIILLAFAIILLSAMVIYIITRKFQTELKAMHGQRASAHAVEVSQTATMLAAVNVGISTMRRRPTRTILTAVTVVMLTFTILCFASFSRQIGVRSTYVGPVSGEVGPSLMTRNLNFSKIEPGLMNMLATTTGKGGIMCGHWWLVPQQINGVRLPYAVSRADGTRVAQVKSVMGVKPDEVTRWSQLASAISRDQPAEVIERTLRDGGVYLPLIIKEQLDVEVGDAILVAGRSRFFAGVFDQSALQRLEHIDGKSVLPVNFEDEMSQQSQPVLGSDDNEMLLVNDTEKDVVHLSASEIVIASDHFVHQSGGDLYLVTFYPGSDADVVEVGRQLAEVVVMPVWVAGRDGVERLLLAVLTEVSGGLALGVPLILGGLIIFGTLLGSINDREKEIYTFSALGLSPVHVGVLFFAEAAVYAALGGMGGQLLAQFVALAASILSEQGYIQPSSINYSSTNALFAISVVMLTVIVSAIYPAIRASGSANPGATAAWRLPKPDGDVLTMVFPFTVSAYDITGVVSYLAEHFEHHDDAGLGKFAAKNVKLGRNDENNLNLTSQLALAPFDLGVTQYFELSAVPSQIPGVDEVAITVTRHSGSRGDWYRVNRVFVRDLRRQFLLWRTLSGDMIEAYRMNTLQELGEPVAHNPTEQE